jgi:hypothetical protein
MPAFYMTPSSVKDYVSRRLSQQQVLPANGGNWVLSARVTSASAVTHPDTLSVYVYGWPASSGADVDVLADALDGLPGLMELQKWPQPSVRRPCVRLYVARTIDAK